MHELFVHPDYIRVGYCKSILDQAGIACFIRNENTHNSLSGMVSPLFFPALCLVNDADIEPASELLREFISESHTPDKTKPAWTCPACGEVEIPGSFDRCWKCGVFRAEDAERED